MGTHSGERLVSVYTDPEWHATRVRERRIEGDTLVCDEFIHGGDQFFEKRLYAIENDQALKMFRNLYVQASQGLRFSDPEYLEECSNPSGLYLIALGRGATLTSDEGGADVNGTIVSEVERWRAERSVGDRLLDGDLAFHYFDDRAFASFATYVVLAVRYFDDLCEIAYESQGQGEAREEEPAR